MRNVGASTPCTVTCTAGSSVSALVGIKGGREVGMEGARSKVGEGAPLGVERECGQCGIGSGGIGSSGIRQQWYPHGGIAGLVFGETQNWFLMCAYGDPCVDIPVRWVLISRCCLLLEKNVVCLVVCSRTSFWKNVSTVLHVSSPAHASEMHPDPPHTTGTPSVDRGCSGCPRCIPIDRPRHACVAAALAIFNF